MTDHERYFPDRCIQCPALLNEMTCGDRCSECLMRSREAAMNVKPTKMILPPFSTVDDLEAALALQRLVAG